MGPVSVAERDALVAEGSPHVETLSALLAAGRSVMFGAFDPELGAVGGGSHNPRGDVTEIVGVGVLPALRRRGIAGHLTWAWRRMRRSPGSAPLFMSAGSDDVARIYEGVGFRRVGHRLHRRLRVRAGETRRAPSPSTYDVDLGRRPPRAAARRGSARSRGARRSTRSGAYAARVTANRPLRRSVKVNRARIPW